MEIKWVLVGAVASLGVGLLAYVLSEDGRHGSQLLSRLRKDEVINILKDLKKESTSILISLAGFSLAHEEEGRARQTKEQCRGYADEMQLKRVAAIVYRRFQVTESEFRKSYEHFQHDPEIRDLADSMLSNLEQAKVGVAPVTSGLIPDSLTPGRLIQLLRTAYRISAGNALEKLETLQNEGIAFSPYDARFLKAAEELEVDMERLKVTLYSKFGLQGEDAATVVKTAVELFAQQKQFLRDHTAVEEEYRSTMQSIALQRLSAESRNRVNQKAAEARKFLASLGS